MKAAFFRMWWSGIRPISGIIPKGCWWTEFTGSVKTGKGLLDYFPITEQILI